MCCAAIVFGGYLASSSLCVSRPLHHMHSNTSHQFRSEALPAHSSDKANPNCRRRCHQYCIRRCSVARLLPAMASRTDTSGASLRATLDASREPASRSAADKGLGATRARAGVSGRAAAGAAARRGSGVRFESRSSAESSFSQFAKEAERMSLESVPGRLFTDLVEFSSISRRDVLSILNQVGALVGSGCSVGGGGGAWGPSHVAGICLEHV